MNSLSAGRVAQTIQRLFMEAEQADHTLMVQFSDSENIDQLMSEIIVHHFAEERYDLHGSYRRYAKNFLNDTKEYGRFLSRGARARRATRIVEFGTSMAIFTIHLATALRDIGGGHLIGTKLQPSKAARVRESLKSAGLADLFEIRVGYVRETLADVGGEVDFVLLDGAFSLYLPLLKLLESRLKTGTPILAENAFDHDNEYLAYVRDPANGYLSQSIPISEGRGSEFRVAMR